MTRRTLHYPILVFSLIICAALILGCTDADLMGPESQDAEALGAEAQKTASFDDSDMNQGVTEQATNVMDQEDSDGDRAVFAEDAATITRTPNGFTAQISMPTPVAGQYQYPDPADEPTAAELGQPQTFTLWAFVFDDEQGSYGDQPWSGAFSVAGHAVGGPNLTLTGHISKSTDPFAGFALENPNAEIHLAVAPHGGLDPDIMPEQISTPAFTAPVWWVAVFEAVE